MSFMNQVRSFREGEVSGEELEMAAELFKRSYPAKQVGTLAEGMDSFYGDIFVCDGDLTVNGDLDLFKPRTLFLWVKGQLRVHGGFFDYDDPETLTLVGGDMHADRVHTAGWLNVLGDLVVNGPLVGYYNDCTAYVAGNLECQLFYPENHFFEVSGRAEIEHGIYIGSRLEASNEVTSMTDEEIATRLARELLVIETGSFDEIEDLEFYLDDGVILEWMREGRPLLVSDE
jgi:hypothetical protein